MEIQNLKFQLLLNHSGQILYCSKEIENICGYKTEDIKSKFIWDLMDKSLEIKNLKDIINNKSKLAFKKNVDINLITKVNNPLNISCNFTFVNNPDNINHTIMCEAFVSSKDKQIVYPIEAFREILNLTSDPFLILKLFKNNKSVEIIDVNDQACRLLKYSKDEFQNDLFSPLSIFKEKTIPIHHKITTSNNSGFVINLINKEGEEVPGKISFHNLDNQGESIIIVLLNPGVEIQSLQKKLKHIKRLEAVGLMASGIAHDFNNVLTGIIGYTELSLRILEKNHPVTNYLKTIMQKSDNAAGLVRKLMFFSKDLNQHPTSTDLNTLIKNTINFLNKYIGEDILFELNLDSDLNMINADQSAIEQIITNLIINARDAMPDGGSIIIKTTNVMSHQVPSDHLKVIKHNHYVKLIIMDTGIGMDQEIKEKMFEPFFTTKEIERGTGLGLATVNEMVKDHNGFIECKSIIGEGTTFEINFPVSLKNIHESTSYELKKVTGGDETILIVEDDLDLLKGFKISLENYGYNVLEANNGKDAMNVFLENINNIKMIVADMVLPEMGGLDLFLLLKEDHPHLCFLLISGHHDKIEKDSHGISGLNYLQKPFHTEDLAGKIREILDTPLS